MFDDTPQSHAYQALTPDVVLNMDQLQLTEIGPDAVQVSGAIGHPAPDQLKLVAGYRNGWMGHAVTGFCWPDAMEKAQAVAQAIAQRMSEEDLQHDELCVEYLGHNAFLGPLASEAEDANEVWLRMAIRTQEKAHADAFPRLFPWLALSGPPYMGGFHGMAPASQLLGLWPTRVDRSVIEPRVHMQWLDAA